MDSRVPTDTTGTSSAKSRRYSTGANLSDPKLTSRGSWGKSNRAIAYFATVAAFRDESSDSQEAATDTQYDEIMDRFQVRLRPDNSDRALRKSNSSPSSVKVHSAEDTDRSAHPKVSTPHLGTSPRSYTEFEPPNTKGSLAISNEPNTNDAATAQEKLIAIETPVQSGRFSLSRFVRQLQKRAATRSEYLLTPMSPYSNISRLRSALLMVSCVAYAVILPVELAFFSVPLKQLKVADEAIDVMLLLDVILMFNTSFVDKHGAVVTQRQEIAVHYLKGSFIPDLLTSIAIYWLQSADNRHPGHVKWYFFPLEIVFLGHRVVRLLHALHLAWLGHNGRSGKSIWDWFLYSRYSHLIRISWILGLVLLLSHYMACFWKYLEASTADFSVDFFDDYTANLYGALQLLQGQGLPTETRAQNLFASFAVLAGSVVLAIVFGHVAMLVSNFNANTTNYQRKMESVFAITTKMQLPVPLRERIHQYYEHLWREYDSLDGEIVNFSKDLTCNLTLEVVLFKYMVLVMQVPFWRECGVDFQKQIVLHLAVRVYLPDDFIIRRGEVSDEFYVINRGFCELESDPESYEHGTAPLLNQSDEGEHSFFSSGRVSDVVHSGRTRTTDPDFYPQRPTSKHLTQLSRGQAFGELALLMNYERTANVRAVSYVEMCVLTRNAFQEVMKKYPKDRRHAIMQILTTCMDRNQAKEGLCPLKRLVHSAIHEGDPSIPPLSTQQTAELVADVIDPKLQDETMMLSMDEKLVQQLTAKKLGRLSNSEISPAMEARFQQMEEAQAQTAELLLARMQQIDEKLEQVMHIVQDRVASSSGTIHGNDASTLPLSTFQKPSSCEADAPQVRRTDLPTATKRSRLVRISPLASTKPGRTSPEEKRRHLLRTHSSPLVRLRSRSASMTKMQATSIAEDHVLVTSEHDGASDKVTALKPKPKFVQRRNSSFSRVALTNDSGLKSGKKPLRHRKSLSFDRASELFGRLLHFHLDSEGPVESPTVYADQLFRASRPALPAVWGHETESLPQHD